MQSHIILNLRGDEPTKTCSLLHITYRTCEAIQSAIDVNINTPNWQILGIPPWFRICVPCQVGRPSSFHGLLLKTAISRCRFCFTIMVYSSRTSNITTKAVSSCEIKPRRMGMSQKSSTVRQIISVPINNRQVENVCNEDYPLHPACDRCIRPIRPIRLNDIHIATDHIPKAMASLHYPKHIFETCRSHLLGSGEL